ncbi:hypothetical protein EYF80_011776 [Liparis tanakae]|uniref:Uncharacterized protein n=1 Tax=Liparis tanakae TaxID=230148 RepID=A0A4Z2ILE6_9TELE|nr:hypothetical protein EYF80_011776 [Liparis tanakae]
MSLQWLKRKENEESGPQYRLEMYCTAHPSSEELISSLLSSASFSSHETRGSEGIMRDKLGRS